jgi:D-alanine-D-alanine ligase
VRKKIRVALFFGGRSAEHEVSLQSARNVYDAIDKNKYEIVLIGIDHKGKWHLNDAREFLLNADQPDHISLKKGSGNLALIPGEESHVIVDVRNIKKIGAIDVAFPILHGPFGEDGTIQGLLKLADLPFVGSGILGSAVAMDKDMMKRILNQANIPQARFLVYYYEDRANISYSNIAEALGSTFFVKPANLGSSVGIGKVHSESEFDPAIAHAFDYDNKIICEENVDGREIECSVLGNNDPIASIPGEIIAGHEFYDYDAKYVDQEGAKLEIPANIGSSITKRIQDLSIKSFKALCLSGMARADFFLKKNGDVLVNELNTIPGFTRISMYPKLWKMSGISYSDLIDRLIKLAIERHEQDKRLKISAW